MGRGGKDCLIGDILTEEAVDFGDILARVGFCPFFAEVGVKE